MQTSLINSQKQVTDQESNISQLQSQISSLSQQVQSLNQQVSTAQETIQNQNTTINGKSSQITSLQNQIVSLNDNIASLQSQLSNAATLISNLQGPTGILPTYMDLNYVGSMSSGYYFLQLTLKNTGSVPITGIFVTLYSTQLTMAFTYLGATVSTNTPLPPYQTASGSLDVSPPVGDVGTYPLVIQAIAANSTVYTYQTSITTDP
ncbi:MAG: hypothetical protein ACLQO7_04430 [Candidatus Bathyarchaeia archaeon]